MKIRNRIKVPPPLGKKFIAFKFSGSDLNVPDWIDIFYLKEGNLLKAGTFTHWCNMPEHQK